MTERASEYLRALLGRLEEAGGTIESVAVEARGPGDERALLDATLRFPENLRLSVFLFADCTGDAARWPRYRFHLMDANDTCLFRFDNAPHHPGLSTFPDHRHDGPDEAVSAAVQPSLEDVLAEIARHQAP
jgi:hypothetical protein